MIEERLAETFAASPGAKMAIEVESIRLLGPDVAKEEGRTIITPGQGRAGDYTAGTPRCSSSATGTGFFRACAKSPIRW